MNPQAGIVIDNVGFSYGDNKVFESVSLEVPKGEVWALLGRSGCGKTTLLHILAGIFQPTRGSVNIYGPNGQANRRIKGMVFQDDSLLGWLFVIDNVLFPLHRKTDEKRRDYAVEILTSVGLSENMSDYPFKLSAGMRKRVEFARAIIADEDYILADEPFGTLDALTRRDLWQLWNQLRVKRPRTGILATHDPEEAVRLCDAVVTMRKGNPGGVSKIIRIPQELRSRGIDNESDEIHRMKSEIIQSLGE